MSTLSKQLRSLNPEFYFYVGSLFLEALGIKEDKGEYHYIPIEVNLLCGRLSRLRDDRMIVNEDGTVSLLEPVKRFIANYAAVEKMIVTVRGGSQKKEDRPSMHGDLLDRFDFSRISIKECRGETRGYYKKIEVSIPGERADYRLTYTRVNPNDTVMVVYNFMGLSILIQNPGMPTEKVYISTCVSSQSFRTLRAGKLKASVPASTAKVTRALKYLTP